MLLETDRDNTNTSPVCCALLMLRLFSRGNQVREEGVRRQETVSGYYQDTIKTPWSMTEFIHECLIGCEL